MTLLALALGYKIGATLLVILAGLPTAFLCAIFGPGAMPETGEGSSGWITILVIMALTIGAIWLI